MNLFNKVTFYIFLGLCIASPQKDLSAQRSKCSVLHDGIDLQTKTHRIEIAPTLLFNHTPPEIKNDLQEDNLMECNAQIVRIEGKASLHLNLRINSQKATSVYGEIAAGHMMKVILIDGKEVELNCYAGSKGVLSQDLISTP